MFTFKHLFTEMVSGRIGVIAGRGLKKKKKKNLPWRKEAFACELVGG